jgi:hypothetical protein
MKQVGCTYPDSSPVRALAFSAQDYYLCTATNDSAKLWHWEPVKQSASASVPWDGVRDILFHAPSSDSGVLLGASVAANVVALWSLQPERMLNDGISRPNKSVIAANSSASNAPIREKRQQLDGLLPATADSQIQDRNGSRKTTKCSIKYLYCIFLFLLRLFFYMFFPFDS